jgi:hypothetical protein
MRFLIIRDNKDGERDVFNEKPTREEQTVAATEPVKGAGSSGTSAVIHTTKGDIVRFSVTSVEWPDADQLTIIVHQIVPRACTKGRGELCSPRSGGLLQRYHLPSSHRQIREPEFFKAAFLPGLMSTQSFCR